MKTNRSSENSGRSRRYRRFLPLAAVLLLTIGLVLFATFLDRGAHSVRFDELQDGMTMSEVINVLKPTFMAVLPPAGHADMTGMELLREPDPNKTIFFCHSETPMFPGFTTIVTFVDGRLTSKELGTPGLRDILNHWWSQAWKR